MQSTPYKHTAPWGQYVKFANMQCQMEKLTKMAKQYPDLRNEIGSGLSVVNKQAGPYPKSWRLRKT